MEYKDIKFFGRDIRVSSDGSEIYAYPYESYYKDGRVAHISSHIFSQYISKFGYNIVSIHGSDHKPHTVQVHDLVAKAFCKNFGNYKEVHHIDGNKLNNDRTNLMWCSREFNMHEMLKSRNIKFNVENHCIDCGKTILRNSTRCSDCSKHMNGLRQKVKSPIPDTEIERLLFENNGNFRKTSALFNITENSLRKRCKKLGLPYHSVDYKKN